MLYDLAALLLVQMVNIKTLVELEIELDESDCLLIHLTTFNEEEIISWKERKLEIEVLRFNKDVRVENVEL